MNWQPIETAPKDGSWILVAGKSHRTNAHMLVCRYEMHPNGCWAPESADDGFGAYIDPTYWMPLPEPPKS